MRQTVLHDRPADRAAWGFRIGARAGFVLAGFLVLCLILAAGCSPRISLLGDSGPDPLKEYVLEGKGSAKVLVLPLTGFISAGENRGLLGQRPSLVREAAAVLKKAAGDKNIKALALIIDSPGGSVAATDMLYREIEAFRAATGARIVAQAMTVCASGGYYLALSADEIQATPASLVGSVGTLFIAPKLAGLMDKIGVEAEVTKSGSLKDMGSPFRPSTEEEKRLTQEMIDQLNGLFLDLLAKRRALSREAFAETARAGVFTGLKAREMGLVDRLGHPAEALARARELAGLPRDAKVVVYRRSKVHDDTYYNPASAGWQGGETISLGPRIGLESLGVPLEAGFYHLWPQALPGARP